MSRIRVTIYIDKDMHVVFKNLKINFSGFIRKKMYEELMSDKYKNIEVKKRYFY